MSEKLHPTHIDMERRKLESAVGAICAQLMRVADPAVAFRDGPFERAKCEEYCALAQQALAALLEMAEARG